MVYIEYYSMPTNLSATLRPLAIELLNRGLKPWQVAVQLRTTQSRIYQYNRERLTEWADAIAYEVEVDTLGITLLHRFLKRIQLDSESDCWLWSGGKNRLGYGRIGRSRHQDKYGEQLAHRFSYRFFRDNNLKQCVLHDCKHPWLIDNPSCVNPSHLHEGTRQENFEETKRRSPGYQEWREFRKQRQLDRSRIIVGDRASGIGPEETCRRLGIGICTYYRLLGRDAPKIRRLCGKLEEDSAFLC